MALSYKRWTEEEDSMRNVLDKGEYPFRVRTISKGMTKSGQYEMLTVELGVMDNVGREWTVKDWVVIMDEMGWKLRHFAATCGIIEKYDSDTLEAADFMGKNGVVRITIRDYEDKEGEIRKSNAVVDYIKPGKAKISAPANDFIDDEIPL